MKKIIIGLLLVSLLTGCKSMEVYEKIKEYTVRQVKEEVELKEEASNIRTEITSDLTNQEIRRLNAYLSDLSNGDLRAYSSEDVSHSSLLWLGHWLYLVDDIKSGYNLLTRETIDNHSYDVFDYNDFNERLQLYFDYDIEKYGDSRTIYEDETFYIQSLDASYWDIYRVTQVDRVYDNGDGSFLVEASIYKYPTGYETTIGTFDKYVQPKSTWTPDMESEFIASATVTIVYSDRLESYVIDNYETEYVSSESLPIYDVVYDSYDIEDAIYTSNPTGIQYVDGLYYYNDFIIEYYGNDSLSYYYSDVEYGLDRLIYEPRVQSCINYGGYTLLALINVDWIDGMSGMKFELRGSHESNPEIASIIGFYFMEFGSYDFYEMNIENCEYERIY